MKKRLLLTVTSILLGALPASWGEEHLTICHFPPGNPENVQIITIGSSAVPHHIGNHPGDGLLSDFPGGVCSIGTPTEPQ